MKIVEFNQEFVFMPRKSCAEIESEFDVWIWKVHSRSIPPDRWAFDCKNCSKIEKTWKSS